MKLVWTKSNSVLSQVIRFICGQDCSHFSFVFESGSRGLMFESNLLGTHPTFYKTSLKNHSVVHEKSLEIPIDVEDEIWDLMVQKYDGRSYDFGGAIFLGLSLAMERIFKMPRPQVNRWAKSDKYFCDETYDIFNSFPVYFPSIDVCRGMDTPHDVFVKMGG